MMTRYEVVSQIKPFIKQELLAKLGKEESWRFVSVSEESKSPNYSEIINRFIENNLDKFIHLCEKVLPIFTASDCESIGTDHPTDNAKKFMDLFNYLEECGFPGPRAYPLSVNFWSGEEARKKASEAPLELSDSHVPSMSIMFDVCKSILKVQQKYDEYIILLTTAVSRVFALNAFDIVHVYVSSEKLSESAGFTCHNNFWLAELPILISLYNREIIKDIQIHLFNHRVKKWDDSISLFSPLGQRIKIRRRNLHYMDNRADVSKFKTPNMTEDERKRWYYSEPRPFITYGNLKRIAEEWRNRTKESVKSSEMNEHEVVEDNNMTDSL